MKRWLKFIGVVAGVFLLFNGVSVLLIESGEVVVLRSEPENKLLARLWVVDHSGYAWVGTDNPTKTRWVSSMRQDPRIRFTRGGVTGCRHAAFVDDRATGKILGGLIEAKYRVPLYGSSFLKFTQCNRLDDVEQIWFRLEPCSEAKE